MRTVGREPSLRPNLLLPSDYCHEWADNKRGDLSLPPFHSVCCVYSPCILNLSPLKATDNVCYVSVRYSQLQRDNKLPAKKQHSVNSELWSLLNYP